LVASLFLSMCPFLATEGSWAWTLTRVHDLVSPGPLSVPLVDVLFGRSGSFLHAPPPCFGDVPPFFPPPRPPLRVNFFCLYSWTPLPFRFLRDFLGAGRDCTPPPCYCSLFSPWHGRFFWSPLYLRDFFESSLLAPLIQPQHAPPHFLSFLFFSTVRSFALTTAPRAFTQGFSFLEMSYCLCLSFLVPACRFRSVLFSPNVPLAEAWSFTPVRLPCAFPLFFYSPSHGPCLMSFFCWDSVMFTFLSRTVSCQFLWCPPPTRRCGQPLRNRSESVAPANHSLEVDNPFVGPFFFPPFPWPS